MLFCYLHNSYLHMKMNFVLMARKLEQRMFPSHSKPAESQMPVAIFLGSPLVLRDSKGTGSGWVRGGTNKRLNELNTLDCEILEDKKVQTNL